MSDPIQKLELVIHITVRQPMYGNGQIELHESLQIPANDFMELCKILAQFDALAKKIRNEP